MNDSLFDIVANVKYPGGEFFSQGNCRLGVAMRRHKHLEVRHPAFEGRIGVARRDITPPVGIYARMWGNAQHDVAEGIHRPLTATVLAVQPLDAGRPLVLASLDLGWWRSPKDERFLRAPVLQAFSLEPAQLMIHLVHTHAGPSTSLQDAHKPGGEKIRPYLLAVRKALLDAICEALASADRATLTWNTGRCPLACHRDQPNPDGPGTVVGYDPMAEADDALLVGRVTDSSGAIRATLVNYACHPTTLGGANRLISPDYVGAMREVVEQATHDRPCLFLNGAAGDLAPRQQYTDRLDVADQNGRQLGHAALAALADMLPHQQGLSFQHVEESGAKLGCWGLVAAVPNRIANAQCYDIPLPSRKFERVDDLKQQLAHCDDRALAERLERKIQLSQAYQDAGSTTLSIWCWSLGDALWIGLPAEAHSPLQQELRRRFADQAVIVMNLVNGSQGYLPPQGDYQKKTYQCSVSLFQPGAHETVLQACIERIEQILQGGEKA